MLFFFFVIFLYTFATFPTNFLLTPSLLKIRKEPTTDTFIISVIFAAFFSAPSCVYRSHFKRNQFLFSSSSASSCGFEFIGSLCIRPAGFSLTNEKVRGVKVP